MGGAKAYSKHIWAMNFIAFTVLFSLIAGMLTIQSRRGSNDSSVAGGQPFKSKHNPAKWVFRLGAILAALPITLLLCNYLPSYWAESLLPFEGGLMNVIIGGALNSVFGLTVMLIGSLFVKT